MNDYDSGVVSATTDYEETVLDNQLDQFMVYPAVAGFIKLNGSTKEIYLPAETWTPILTKVDSFSVKTVTGTGDIYWQGWFA